jgi:YggT family protein
MVLILVRIVELISTALFILILAYVVLSFFMSPYHPVRETIGRIVDPILTPIRRVVRPLGGLDLSPLILLIMIQIVEYLIKVILFSLV